MWGVPAPGHVQHLRRHLRHDAVHHVHRVGQCDAIANGYPTRVEERALAHPSGVSGTPTSGAASAVHPACAVGESSVILLQPPLHSAGVSIGMERKRQHNDSSLVRGYGRLFGLGRDPVLGDLRVDWAHRALRDPALISALRAGWISALLLRMDTPPGSEER